VHARGLAADEELGTDLSVVQSVGEQGQDLHPNDAGYQAMANAIDVGALLHH
jgi:hypothetical protein